LGFVCLMVFNATFNNISVILWRSVLLVEETGGPWENNDLSQVTDKLYHIMLYTSPWSRFKLTISVIIGTDFIGSCKSNNHMIIATTAPTNFGEYINELYLKLTTINAVFLFNCFYIIKKPTLIILFLFRFVFLQLFMSPTTSSFRKPQSDEDSCNILKIPSLTAISVIYCILPTIIQIIIHVHHRNQIFHITFLVSIKFML
jgi:hypothetical protein